MNARAGTIRFLALLRKDLRLELRTRDTIVTMLLFAATLMLIFQFGIGARSSALESSDGQPAQVDDITPLVGGILWAVIALTAVLGVTRAWVPEREQRVLDALLVSPVSRSTLLASKVVSLYAYLLVVQLLVLPLTFVFFVRGVGWEGLALVALVCLVANLCIAVLGSLISSLALFSRAREVLVPVLFLPSLLPVVIPAGGATHAATQVTIDFAEYRGYLLLLGVYALIFGLVAYATYDHVFDD